MNYVYISPNYPSIYANFCEKLKSLGLTTLGIGDEHYQKLSDTLKNSLTEYYKVNSLANLSEVYDALTHFTKKYGKIYGLESNNEFWLENDSYYRECFDIDGMRPQYIDGYKRKSKMKTFFTLGGAPVASYVVTKDLDNVLAFAATEGYPIFAKPDNGVGANGAKKIKNASDLVSFFETPLTVDYIFEQYIEGNLYSYDGLTDNEGNIVFDTCHHFITPIDKLMESGKECIYRTLPIIPPELKRLGSRVVREFRLKGRFFHIEFFELTAPLNAHTKIGDFVALEANMRIAGGLTPDMISAANGFDVYSAWAQCVTSPSMQPIVIMNAKYCTNTARIKNVNYKYTREEIKRLFSISFLKSEVTCLDYTPFGNEEFLAVFNTVEECVFFEKVVSEKI